MRRTTFHFTMAMVTVSLLVFGTRWSLRALAAPREVRAPQAAPVSWNVDSDGFWDVGSNWSTGSVPGVGDDVVISRTAPVTVTMRGNASVRSIQNSNNLVLMTSNELRTSADSQIGGTLILSGSVAAFAPLTLTGATTWGDGALSGGSLISNTGVLTLSGSAVKTLNTSTLVNNGIMVQPGSGNLLFYAGAVLNNRSGALYDMQADAGFVAGGYCTYGSCQFNNAGIFRKSGLSGNSTIGAAFNNQGGSIDVRSGTLTLTNGDGNSGGVFSVSAAAILDLTGGGSVTHAGIYTGTGSGTVRLSAGSLIVGAAGATFNFPPGMFQWSGGFIGGTGVLTNRGTLTAAGAGDKTISTLILSNTGTIIYSATGNLVIERGGSLNNAAAGLFDLQGDASVAQGSYGGSFSNAGIFRKSGGSASTISVPFSHLGGTMDVLAGSVTLIPAGGASTGGIFNVATGAALDLTGGGNIYYAGTYTGSGGGQIRLSSGQLTAGGPGTTFNFPPGLFQWTGGTLAASAFTNTGTISLAGSAVKELSESTFNNRGAIFQGGSGNLQLSRGAVLNNAAGGLYDLQTDAGIIAGSYCPCSLSNAGNFRKSGGGGSSAINIPFDNAGTVEVAAGELDLNSTVAQLATTTLSGGWNILNGSVLLIPSLTNSNIIQNAGTVVLSGPSARFDNLNTLAANSGSLSLLNGRNLSTLGGFSNTGQLALGGTLAVNGNFTQTAGAALSFQLGGPPASGLAGRLSAATGAALSGTLNISLTNGYGTSAGDSYALLSYASHLGTFSAVNGLSIGGQKFFTLSVNPSDVILQAIVNAADLQAQVANDFALARTPGQMVTVHFTVTNGTTTTAQSSTGRWIDSVYVSPGSAWDLNAQLIGTVEHTGSLAGLGSYGTSLTAPLPFVLDGAYHVIVVADSRRLVGDLNRANNYAPSTATISVSTGQLELTYGVPVTGTIQAGQDVYYRVNAASGRDIRLSANFPSADLAEVYVRYNNVPGRAHFDFAATNLSGVRQDILITGASAGAYYVVVHGREGAAPSPFSIVANEVLFEVRGANPNRGSNIGQATLSLDGSGFSSSSAVSLIAGDSSARPAASRLLQSSNRLFATFDLRGLAPGPYTVRVTDPAGTASSVFTVTSGPPGRVEYRLTTPGAIRSRRQGTIIVDFENVGETDVAVTTIALMADNAAVAPTSQGVFAHGAVLLPVSDPSGPAGILRPGARSTLAASLLSESDVAHQGIAVTLFVSDVPSSTTRAVSVPARVAGSRSSAAPLEANPCPPNLITFAETDPSSPGLIGITMGRPKPGTHYTVKVTDPSGNVRTIMIPPDTGVASYQAVDLAKIHQTDVQTIDDSSGGVVENCGTQFAPAKLKKDTKNKVDNQTTKDPNDLVGPLGFGTARFVAADQTLLYTIHFENVPTATAAVQVLTVTQVLDADLDLSTFEIGEMGFGNLTTAVPGGRNDFSTRLDLRSSLGLLVDVSVSINSSTRVATWLFTAIDPETGQLTADPSAGFLPPNASAPQGEGFVTYRVRPLAGSPSGTRLDAQARVYFDLNAPLDTPAVFNTVDAGAPGSAVDALAPFSPASFTLRWSGADEPNGSGIAFYDIYVSRDGGSFTPFLLGATGTSATFTGQVGRRYTFYSVATDNVGHRQPTPTAAQATTTVNAYIYLPLVRRGP